MWLVQPSDVFARHQRQFDKRHREVLVALLANVQAYHEALDARVAPMNLKGGFIHPEGHRGLVAVDNTGAPARQRAARLYMFPDGRTRVLHPLAIGFKDSQESDLKRCRRLVDSIVKGANNG